MDILFVMNRFCQRIQSSVTELCHLLLAEGLPLLSEQQGQPLLVDVTRVLRVKSAEGRQQVFMRGR